MDLEQEKYRNTMNVFFSELNEKINNSIIRYQGQLDIFFDELLYRNNLFKQFETETDRYLSSKFNIFDLLNPDENKLSDILAIILDPQGDHGQGDLFWKEFLNFIKAEGVNIPYGKYKILREVSANGRIDLLIESNNFAIIIENKPFAIDQRDQLNRYYDSTKVKHGENILLLYLNKDDSLPNNFSDESKKQQIINLRDKKKMLIIPYYRLKDYLKKCYQECDSNKFRFFLNDFIDYISNTFFYIERRSDDYIE